MDIGADLVILDMDLLDTKKFKNGINLYRPKIDIDFFEYYYDQFYNKKTDDCCRNQKRNRYQQIYFYIRKSNHEE